MSKFPSNKVIILTACIIIIYLIIDFRIKGKRDFFQLNYDWDSKHILDTIKNIKIDSVSYDFLKLNIINKTRDFQLNTNNSYSLDDTYFFRCASIDKNKENLIFTGVYWINKTPYKTEITELEVINLPIIQKGTKSVCMIGDSQLTWLEGKYTRKNISKKIKDITFVGSERDVFGYPYQSKLLNSSEKILESITELPQADIYIFFIGAHESNDLNTEENIYKIVDFILKDQAKLILVIPPIISSSLSDKQETIKKAYFKYKENDNIKIIDLSLLSSNPNLFLMKDGIHLNLFGHETLTKNLIDALND